MKIDNTAYAIEAKIRILEELEDRTEDDPSPEDRQAVTTAVDKALLAGFRQGVASMVFSAQQQGVHLTSVVTDADEVDLWAERYGEDGEA